MVADTVLGLGGRVTGVMPEAIVRKEVAHTCGLLNVAGYSMLIVSDDPAPELGVRSSSVSRKNVRNHVR